MNQETNMFQCLDSALTFSQVLHALYICALITNIHPFYMDKTNGEFDFLF